MPKLPFGTLPGHWGLVGKTREIAKAEYELTGYELETELLRIKREDMPIKEYNRRYIEVNNKYGKYNSQIEYLRALAALIEDDTQKQLAILELDFKEGKINELTFQKESATLRKEPWVTVVNMDFSGKTPQEGSFELDWNSFFVDQLKESGYNAQSPDAIVNMWFMEVCRNVAMEEFDGTGDFTADSEANLETFKRFNESSTLANGKKQYK